jgi:glycine oxidase
VQNRTKVTVVGGGLIGCAVAYELGRRDMEVCVLERRAVGRGATQASAGMLAPFIEAAHAGPLRQLGSRSLELYDQFMVDVAGDSGDVVPYERCGTLDTATDAVSLARLERAASELSTAGVECRLLSRAEALADEPHLGQAVCGALLVPSHGYVGASALTTSLGRAAARQGVSFLSPCTVTRLTSTRAGIEVETDHGPKLSDVVVIAAGSWTGDVAVGEERPLPVKPVRGQLLRLRWPGGPRLTRVVWSPGCYVVPWRDGTTLVGATVEDVGFDERATVAGVASLLEAAREVLPATARAGFDAVRVGLRPGTSDDLPVVGWSSSVPRLLYATGHYRNGVLLAPLTARLVADLVLGAAPDPMLDALAPGRFDTASRAAAAAVDGRSRP